MYIYMYMYKPNKNQTKRCRKEAVFRPCEQLPTVQGWGIRSMKPLGICRDPQGMDALFCLGLTLNRDPCSSGGQSSSTGSWRH